MINYKLKIIITSLLIFALILSILLVGRERKVAIMVGTEYETPIFYLDNGRDLEVLIIAGIHGNELAGILAAERIIDEALDWANFIIIPRANVEAVKLGVRYPYYMQDLNRAFPGKGTGRDTEVLAYEIFEFIETLDPDLILDLQEWERRSDEDGTHYCHGLIIGSNGLDIWKAVEGIVREYNSKFGSSGVKLIIEAGVLDGSLNKEVWRGLGIPVITIESNMKLGMEDRVDFQLFIIEQLLGELSSR